jgi:hypothetical protein
MLELETFNKIEQKQAIGSKHVIKNQRYYFGKGLHIIFPKKTFYMQMNFWMKFFVTFFLKY